MAQYVRQQTLQYSTFVKRALVEALQAAFLNHPSPTVANARVDVEWSHKRWQLPGVLIKFYERDIPNAGVGHIEYLPAPGEDPESPGLWLQYHHRYYKGDVGFDIYGQSSVDRDVIRDGLVEILTAWDLTAGGFAFLERFYYSLDQTPYGDWHFPVLILDQLIGYGESTERPPWNPEDDLVYKVSYRVPIFGEFYSNTPQLPSALGPIEEVDVYPTIGTPDGHIIPTVDPADANTWYRFTGSSSTTETI